MRCSGTRRWEVLVTYKTALADRVPGVCRLSGKWTHSTGDLMTLRIRDLILGDYYVSTNENYSVRVQLWFSRSWVSGFTGANWWIIRASDPVVSPTYPSSRNFSYGLFENTVRKAIHLLLLKRIFFLCLPSKMYRTFFVNLSACERKST